MHRNIKNKTIVNKKKLSILYTDFMLHRGSQRAVFFLQILDLIKLYRDMFICLRNKRREYARHSLECEILFFDPMNTGRSLFFQQVLLSIEIARFQCVVCIEFFYPSFLCICYGRFIAKQTDNDCMVLTHDIIIERTKKIRTKRLLNANVLRTVYLRINEKERRNALVHFC